MTYSDLVGFAEKNEGIVFVDDVENEMVKFRNEDLPWYQKDLVRSTNVPYDILEGMNEERLLKVINKGLKVEHITRVTGYMSKVGNWNPGKKGELKDRRKFSVT